MGEEFPHMLRPVPEENPESPLFADAAATTEEIDIADLIMASNPDKALESIEVAEIVARVVQAFRGDSGWCCFNEGASEKGSWTLQHIWNDNCLVASANFVQKFSRKKLTKDNAALPFGGADRAKLVGIILSAVGMFVKFAPRPFVLECFTILPGGNFEVQERRQFN